MLFSIVQRVSSLFPSLCGAILGIEKTPCISVEQDKLRLHMYHFPFVQVLKAIAGQFAQATKGGVTDADVNRGKLVFVTVNFFL